MSEIRAEELEDEDFETILSPDIEFSGNISFARPFMIRGKVTGNIDATGLLVIDEQAVVNADISADRVVIKGSVTGNVSGRERVEITVTGRLDGNVTTPEVFMETGCVFNGQCNMTKPKAGTQEK
jgi:cytoskeletal protein CcmA (bactofilin family)